MTPAFVPGNLYNRRIDIHAEFGGQQQGGIITPAKYPFVLIITGAEGLAHGYNDGWAEDGSFRYFGEGQVGDMMMKAGNLAIQSHREKGKALILFENTGKGLRCIDYMEYVGHHVERSPDREGNERDAVVFRLLPAGSTHLSKDVTDEVTAGDLALPIDELRLRALASSMSVAPSTERRSTYRIRSKDVKAYALARSGGKCECCDKQAPFKTKKGVPYLEVHHMDRVADDGPDNPEAVAAICPNCHTRIHFGEDGDEVNRKLKSKTLLKETLHDSMRI